MKIAHVTATFPPYWSGTGIVAYHNARLLHRRGHHVTVVTGPQRGDGSERFPFAVEYLPARLHIGNAPLTPALLDRLRGFDLIHLHYPYIFGADLSALAARRYGTPLVITYHNDLLAPGLRGAAFRLYNASTGSRVINRASQVIVTSHDYGRHSLLAGTFPLPAGTVEIPNGVDLDTFRPGQPDRAYLARLGIPAGASVVLFVGALDRAHFFKGVPILLQALQDVHGAHAILAGDGNLREELERLGEQVVPGRAHFVGSVSLSRLVGLYRSATVTVLPSTTRGEAFGVVLLESLACETPVIASDLPGVRTVVSDGVDGHLVPPGNAVALATAINALCASASTRWAMGSRGRAKVATRYSWETVAQRLESAYRNALDGCRRPTEREVGTPCRTP